MSMSARPVFDKNDDPDVFARMDRFRQTGTNTKEKEAPSRLTVLVVLSYILLVTSIALFICTLAVICAPESSFAQAIGSACKALF